MSAPIVRVVDRDIVAHCRPGMPLLFELLDAGVSLFHMCGGSGTCGTCNLEVIEGMENLSQPEAGEKMIVSRLKRRGPNVRLACQTMVRGDVTVRIGL